MTPFASPLVPKQSPSVGDEVAPESRPALPSERLPLGRLPRVLRPRDLTVLCLFAVLLINNVQTVGAAGGGSLLYWALGFLCFLIPSALVCAQLYRLFPGEGAVYLWANRAFGNFWDTFLGFFCNWWPGAIGLTVEAEAAVASIQSLNSNWLSLPWEQGVAAVLVLLVAQLLCALGQRQLQRILNIVFAAYALMFGLVGLAGLGWLLSGQPLRGDFSAHSWQLSVSSLPVLAIVTVALLGMAVPLNMGGEVVDQRRSERYLLWGTLIIIAGYLFAAFGVLAVLSPAELKETSFVSILFNHVFGSEIGDIISDCYYIIMFVYFICATAAYNAMFGRLLFVAGLDRRLPRALARLNSNGVPFNAMLLQTVINIVFIFVICFVAPVAPNQELALTVFLVVINGASVIWDIAMISLFLCGILLCSRYSRQLRRRWVVPSPLFYLSAVLGIALTGVAIGCTFFAGSPVPAVLNNEDWGFWVLLFVLASLTVGAIYSFLVPEAEDLAALLPPDGQASVSPLAANPALQKVSPVAAAPGPLAGWPGGGRPLQGGALQQTEPAVSPRPGSFPSPGGWEP
ncbi:MAG: APC family permease [Thermogemmatispora sp.]|uniref:APC family permease n=1 Tax=Thermogemmatispora sp. TaxID=1968838 RepID=UPI00262F0655|nr:APC family permease [Thermogemmatispora sp.]MBX5456944.1 APC family permease [Thermogemmatispora sp.]